MRWSQAFPAALGVWGIQPGVQFSGEANRFPNLWGQPVVTEWSAKPDRMPWRDAERVRWNERQRAVEFSPSSAARAWMLAFWQVPTAHLGVIERLTSYIRVSALDDDGIPIATTVLNGQDPTIGLVQHPDPARGALRLRWRLTSTEWTQNPPPPNLDGIPAEWVPGEDLLPFWELDQYGWDVRWGDHQQLLVDAQSRIRLWLEVQQTVAGVDFWFIRATGRIGGFAQANGPGKAALFDARQRS